MKTWIKQKLKESLEEVSVKPKKVFGRGAYHKVYYSHKNPDKLYKVGDEEKVDEWVETFQRNPQYFPKVYRVFPYSKDPTFKVVEIEKLNTVKAAQELEMIDNFLLDITSVVNCENLSSSNFFDKGCFQGVIEVAEDSENPYLPTIIFKWAKFLRAVTPIVEKDLGRYLDLHSGNVAYDKMGKLKMIDI